MKYLRKFATEADIANVERPGVALSNDTGAVKYYPKFKNGVYIQHINGDLFTTEEWGAASLANDEANGIAVIDDAASFVISKDRFDYAYWATTDGEVPGLTLYSSVYDAKTNDFNGQANTAYIIESGNAVVAQICADYIFPNGAKGYLGSMGEWNIAYNYRSAIVAARQLIGCSAIPAGVWTSSQRDASRAYVCAFSSGQHTDATITSTRNYSLAFAPLNS